MKNPGRKLPENLYWLDVLSGELPATTFAPDYPRSPRAGSDYAVREFHLDERVVEGLLYLERSSECSIFSILTAALAVVLSKYLRGDELILGVASRVVGSTSAPILPLPIAVDRGESCRALLARLSEQIGKAFENQEVDFGELLRMLGFSDSPDRSPLFDVAVSLDGYTRALDLESYPVDAAFAFRTAGRGTRCRLHYRSSLYRTETIDRLSGHVVNALAQLGSGRDSALRDIEILSAEEIHQLVFSLNDNAASFPLGRTFHGLFEDQVLASPNEAAAVFRDDSLTYAELNAAANRLAWALVASGLQKGEFVAILQDRSCEFLTAMLAVFKAGGAYIPVDPTYPLDRMRYMLTDSRAAYLVTEAATLSKVSEFLADLRDLRVVVSQKGRPEGGLAEGLSVLGPEELASFPVENLDLPSSGEDRAYMIYTSGSTGLPKGAICRHDGALNHLFGELSGLGIRDAFSFLQTAASSSDISVWQFLAPILKGGATHIVDHDTVVDPEALFGYVQRHRIDLVELVPVVLRALVDYAARLPESRRALPALRCMMATGDALPVDVVNSWFALYPTIPVGNTYGPTEASDDVTLHVMRDPLPPDRTIVPIGRPMPNLSIFILDPSLRLAPLGVPGEICVSGTGVGEGYWNQPEKTEAVFIRNPIAGARGATVYRTGDLGRWLPDGTIEFLGRLDQQVKIRGFRIEPGEVESALLKHDGVAEAVVLARPDRAGNRTLVAYVVPEPCQAPSAVELRSFLAESLPDYMVPSVVVTLDAMPLTPIGKIDRKALPGIGELPHERGASYVEPKTETERVMARIWADILGITEVGSEDNFFELGGDSILAITLATRANDAGFAIRPKNVLHSSSLAELAEAADARKRTGTLHRNDSKALAVPLTALDSSQLRRIKERYPGLEDLYPLTPTQLGLYLHWLLYPRGSGIYIEQIGLNLAGDLSLDALEEAFRWIIGETPVLRTAVTRRGLPMPVQVVVGDVPFELRRIDWRNREVSDAKAALEALALDERARGFDLGKPPLMRATAVRLDEDRHHLLWTYHHIVLDGWSEPLVLGSVFRAQAALREGRRPVPEPSPPYRDFVAWLERQDWTEAETYWREKLAGFTEPSLIAPASQPDGAGPSGISHGWLERRLDREETERLESTARRWRLTVSTILQGAWALLLCQVTHRRDVVFGLATSGREIDDVPGIQSIPGLFITTLPVRAQVSDHAAVRPWLKLLQLSNVEMRQFEQIGMPRLQAASEVPKEMLPLFDSIVVTANYPGSELSRELGTDLTVTDIEYTTMPHYPVTLFVVAGERMALRLVYSRRLFTPEAVALLLDRYGALLDGICADPEQPLRDLLSRPHVRVNPDERE
jgi:amino acid adenylation domain-containing protein